MCTHATSRKVLTSSPAWLWVRMALCSGVRPSLFLKSRWAPPWTSTLMPSTGRPDCAATQSGVSKPQEANIQPSDMCYPSVALQGMKISYFRSFFSPHLHYPGHGNLDQDLCQGPLPASLPLQSECNPGTSSDWPERRGRRTRVLVFGVKHCWMYVRGGSPLCWAWRGPSHPGSSVCTLWFCTWTESQRRAHVILQSAAWLTSVKA